MIEDTDRGANLPKHLRLTMNRQGFKGQYMAARGKAEPFRGAQVIQGCCSGIMGPR